MTERELREYGYLGLPLRAEPLHREQPVVAVFARDGLSYQWECGACGDTMRGYSSEAAAQDGADVHEVNCPELAKEG